LVVAVVIVVAVAVIALVASFVLRRPRQDPGIVGFRRHIDALSPESRREMKDRMREQLPEQPDVDDGGS
jgi:regulator of protease activity HflC (stomatin/prohibitin superfamily)